MSTHMITRRRFIFSTSLAPVLASCASDLDRYKSTSLQKLASHLGICSTNYATLKNGKIQEIATISGCSNKRPSSVDTVFQAASLTKPVVAYAALQLVLAGELDLASPVSRYLPQGYKHFHRILARKPTDHHDVMPSNALSSIPLGTLLNHTSGLPNWSNTAMSLSFTPGSSWQYSGEGYMLLQSILEAVTGQSISSFMDAHVFTPLGMHRSSLVWKEDGTGQLHLEATPGFWSPRPVKLSHPLAAASLYTTAEDYAKFLCAVVKNEQLTALTLSSPTKVKPELGIEWGYGWGIEHGPSGPNLWQWGNNPGFRSFAMISPISGHGFVVLTNHYQGMAMAVPIAHDVLPGEHKAFSLPMVG